MTNPTTTQYLAASQYLQSVDKNISAGEVWVFAVLAFHSDAYGFRTDVRRFTAAERQYLNYLVARGLVTVKREHRPVGLPVLAATPARKALVALSEQGHLQLLFT